MIVVDTTILMYAVGAEHPAREPSRRLIEAIGAGRIAATTTPEVVQEFVHIVARQRPRARAAQHARRYVALLSPLMSSEAEHLERALRLFERHPNLGAFDALLAATALVHGAEALVSADADFAAVPRLSHIAPGTPEFERLLAA